MRGQPIERLVEFQHVHVAALSSLFDGSELDLGEIAAALLAHFAAGLVDENPPHRFGSRGEEVAAGGEGRVSGLGAGARAQHVDLCPSP